MLIMNKHSLWFLLFCILCFSCEEVIVVDLEESESQIVIEAEILNETNMSIPFFVQISLSFVIPFFSLH